MANTVVDAPKKPAAPFISFLKALRPQVRRSHPDLSGDNLTRTIAQMWRSAPESIRQEYKLIHQQAWLQYKQNLEHWKAQGKEIAKREENTETDNNSMALDDVPDVIYLNGGIEHNVGIDGRDDCKSICDVNDCDNTVAAGCTERRMSQSLTMTESCCNLLPLQMNVNDRQSRYLPPKTIKCSTFRSRRQANVTPESGSVRQVSLESDTTTVSAHNSDNLTAKWSGLEVMSDELLLLPLSSHLFGMNDSSPIDESFSWT
jgi:hypothetical protein